MNTLQQDDMPLNMDEGCRQHLPLQDQFPVVIQCSACFWYDRSSHCRVFSGSISCGQSHIETHQATAYLTTNTPKRHAFHLPNPIILCKCKVCYSLVAYWKLATLRGSNQLVHILIKHCCPFFFILLPCTLFDARFNLFSAGRTAPRGSEPDPYKQ